MHNITMNSRGGGGLLPSLYNPERGAGCSFLCPQKGGVSYLDSMTSDVLW